MEFFEWLNNIRARKTMPWKSDDTKEWYDGERLDLDGIPAAEPPGTIDASRVMPSGVEASLIIPEGGTYISLPSPDRGRSFTIQIEGDKPLTLRLPESSVKLIENQDEFYKAAQENKAQAGISEASPLYPIDPRAVRYITTSYAPLITYTLPWSQTPPQYRFREDNKIEEPAPERIDPREQTKREILI